MTYLRRDEESSGGRVAGEEGVEERDRLSLVAGHERSFWSTHRTPQPKQCGEIKAKGLLRRD